MKQQSLNTKCLITITFLFIINLNISTSISIVDTFFPLYLTNTGVSGLLFSVTIASYTISKMLALPLFAYTPNNTYKKKMLILSTILLLIASQILNHSNTALLLIIARSMQGIAMAIFRPMVLLFLRNNINEENKASIIGTFDISFYTSIVIGPILGGWLNDTHGFQSIAFISVILCLISIILIVYAIPDITSHSDKTRRSYNLKDALMNNRLLCLYLFIFGRGYIIATSCSFLPIFLNRQHNMASYDSGFIITISTLIMIILLRPSGKLADRFAPISLITIGGFSISFLFILIPVITTFTGFVMLYIAIGAFSALSQPATTLTLIAESSKNDLFTPAIVFNFFMGLGFSSGILFSSLIMNSICLYSVFLVASLISFTMTILAYMFYHSPLKYCINKDIS